MSEVHERMLNIINHQRNAIKKNTEVKHDGEACNSSIWEADKRISYVVSLRPVWSIWDPVSKHKTNYVGWIKN